MSIFLTNQMLTTTSVWCVCACVSQVEAASLQKYFLFGVLCGIALHNDNIISLRFPLVLFKKLVNVKPSLEDMEEFEPVMAK